jgi:hypothetical protein
MEGIVEKRAGILNTFQKRYFVRVEDTLFYYLSKADLIKQPNAPRAHFHLTQLVSVVPSDGKDSDRRLNVVFKHKDRENKQVVLQLRTNTKVERDAWISVLSVWKGVQHYGKEHIEIPEKMYSGLLECIKFCKMHGTEVEELFRMSGGVLAVSEICQYIRIYGQDYFSRALLRPAFSVYDVASALKKILRTLPEPLLTFELCEAFTSAQDLSALKNLIFRLPSSNFSILRELLLLCDSLLKNEKASTTVEALGICLGPTLVRQDMDLAETKFTQLFRLFMDCVPELEFMQVNAQSRAEDRNEVENSNASKEVEFVQEGCDDEHSPEDKAAQNRLLAKVGAEADLIALSESPELRASPIKSVIDESSDINELTDEKPIMEQSEKETAEPMEVRSPTPIRARDLVQSFEQQQRSRSSSNTSNSPIALSNTGKAKELAEKFEKDLRGSNATEQSPNSKSTSPVNEEPEQSLQAPALQRTPSKTQEMAHAFEEQLRLSRSGSLQNSRPASPLGSSGRAKELAELFEKESRKEDSHELTEIKEAPELVRVSSKTQEIAKAFEESNQRLSQSGSLNQDRPSSLLSSSGRAKELAELFEKEKQKDSSLTEVREESQAPKLNRSPSRAQEMALAFEEQQKQGRSGSIQKSASISPPSTGRTKELAEAFEQANDAVISSPHENDSLNNYSSGKAKEIAESFEMPRKSTSESAATRPRSLTPSSRIQELVSSIQDKRPPSISTELTIETLAQRSPRSAPIIMESPNQSGVYGDISLSPSPSPSPSKTTAITGSNLRHLEMRHWSVSQVCEWLESSGFESFVPAFFENEWGGRFLAGVEIQLLPKEIPAVDRRALVSAVSKLKTTQKSERVRRRRAKVVGADQLTQLVSFWDNP